MKVLLYFFAKAPTASQQETVSALLNTSDDREYVAYGDVDTRVLQGKANVTIIQGEQSLLSQLVEIDEVICFSAVQPELAGKFLSTLFSNAAKKICWVDESGTISLFQANPIGEKILFVFPGSIVPLSLGSHQRAFNLLFNLSRHGYAIDVLIPQDKNIKRELLTQSLQTVCSRVYFYKNKAKKYSKLHVALRGLDRRWRALQGKSPNLPDLFSERDFYKPTESAKRWVNSLVLANGYPTIIVSYTWMMAVIAYIGHFREHYKVVCDTHDVQYHRNLKVLNRRERLFFNAEAEKNLEIKRLESADAVLAISVSDAKVLSQQLKTQVLTVSAGFDYALERVKKRPQGRPIHFGFIGGSMDANVRALEYIIQTWWPVIKQHSPDSLLYVAGSVSKSPVIQKLAFFDENIVSLGFVKNIQDFYNNIEVSLNPVLVQGGLNFKSVEAVFSGKHLVTNSLGAECLGEDFLCQIIDDPAKIPAFMNSIEFDLDYDQRLRMDGQKKARSMFSNKIVTTDFIKFLRSSAG